MRIRGIVGALAACSLLAGCGIGSQEQGQPETVTPTPAPVMSSVAASPTPSSSPSATAPTAAATTKTEKAAANVFTFNGYGQLRLGMTTSEGVNKGIVRPIPNDPCAGYQVAGPYAGQPLFPTFGERKALVQIAANKPGPATWKGAQVGMTWGQIKQRHPDATIVAKEGDGGTFYAGEIRDGSAMILFLAAEPDDDNNLYGGTLMTHPNWKASEEIDSMALAPYSQGVHGGC